MYPIAFPPGLSCSPCPESPKDEGALQKIAPPPAGHLYHAAYPDFGGWEDEVSVRKVDAFQALVKKDIAWAYFSNNWWPTQKGIHFPIEALEAIKDSGVTPFVRMMPRSQDPDNGNIQLPDETYSMQSFVDGVFDDQLRAWALAAKNYKSPLMVEFGTEVNGDWFPWNATWNGAQETTEYGDPSRYDGMERFRDAYRHVIDLFRSQGVSNVTWVFHVDLYSSPETAWNQVRGYYPGDDYIDWIGVSAYGAQVPEDTLYSMQEMLDDRFEAIEAISDTGKPIALLEWGATEQADPEAKARWIQAALKLFEDGGPYAGKIQALSYWHENFDDTKLRLDSSSQALRAYQQGVGSKTFLGRVRLVTQGSSNSYKNTPREKKTAGNTRRGEEHNDCFAERCG